MSDFPNARIRKVTLHTLNMMDRAVTIGTATSAAAWPTANLAFAIPFRIDRESMAKRLFLSNGTVVAGNIDIGIYREDLSLLVSAGTTAQAGGGTLQFIGLTATPLLCGRYYLAAVLSNIATATVYRYTPSAPILRANGALQSTLAAALLADPFVPDAGGYGSAFLPCMGIEVLRAL